MGLGRLSACFALALTAGSPAVGAAPSFGGCPAFPADNYWNTRVDNLPLHPSSMAWVNSIGAATHLHPDCCNVIGEPYGFSPTAVPGTQPLVPITYYAGSPANESDPGPFPIPPALALGRHAGTDNREVVVVDASACTLYELYGAPVSGGSSWIVDSSAKWDLRSNALRPEGHVSADRAGLPMLPGLLRWQEVAAGEVGHAIRFTASNIWGQIAATGAMKYLWPARHGVGTNTDETLPPLGARFRLKASFDIGGFDARTQVILRAFKKYGIVLSSGGGNWYLQGDDDAAWPDSVVEELRSVIGDNFEAIDTAPMMVDVNSGQAVQLDAPPPPPPAGDDGFPPAGLPSGWIQPAGSSAAWVVRLHRREPEIRDSLPRQLRRGQRHLRAQGLQPGGRRRAAIPRRRNCAGDLVGRAGLGPRELRHSRGRTHVDVALREDRLELGRERCGLDRQRHAAGARAVPLPHGQRALRRRIISAQGEGSRGGMCAPSEFNRASLSPRCEGGQMSLRYWPRLLR